MTSRDFRQDDSYALNLLLNAGSGTASASIIAL